MGAGDKAPAPTSDGEGNSVLARFEKFSGRISALFEWIGLAALLMMMVTTCIDVVGAKVFLWRLFGAIDVVMLCQLVAIAFASSMTLIVGQHIQVEFFYNMWSRRTQAVISSVVVLLQLGLFLMIIWRIWVLGYSFQTSGEYSATAHILYYPYAYGVGFACIPVCFALIVEFIKSIKKAVEK